ncbi:PalH/RIM21-domain-containing protein [Talaromyces proteolyticus]|uniref:PalH/RIM21-domain-containing protein n=1 Tax=Talaromyces proteolyticus TaxID=1131652 RepID=A0AAD4L0G8_9EURO|nr:PalH/RIM21-domain-containing protein [Talaromyces proteolyticus]KAH8705303.1 PalH/RIM21-domain-containing protein [Talaromyces proteolyticus]
MDLERRQIWARPTSTSSIDPSCTPFLLPSNGVLSVNSSFSVTISQDVVYQPVCTGDTDNTDSLPSAILNTKDPFYSSVGPQLYAIGCMTVVSYLLVIILLITPRTFYIGGPGGGGNFLGRHGMISGSYSGSSSIVGVGGRPWLQKVAALTVAISLTIATVDSFRVAERQYSAGYTDATALTEEVIDGTEIRIVRVISSTFLWLAQVQTLIRLFPRHKEKVMIKWAGFALIVLDTAFSILDNFVAHGSNTHPRLFDDAIPALSYLFELALNLLYAAWVIFYSLSKHRFAYFHPKMRNICLVAMLSLIAVMIPVIFFIMDIASPDVAGWGEYIRWVGSAAASVVVWEWVERIEALERDERKDGILGREVFDGDEMLEITPSEEIDWTRQTGARGNDGGHGTGVAWGGVIGLNHRPLRRSHLGFQLSSRSRQTATNGNTGDNAMSQNTPGQPMRPPAAVTPVSRADTTSAASTVYYVRYHPVASPTPPVPIIPDEHEGESDSQNKEAETGYESRSSDRTSSVDNRAATGNRPGITPASIGNHWFSAANIFKRRRTSPPQEVATAQEQDLTQDESSVADEINIRGKENNRSRIQQILSSLPHGPWHQGSDARTQRQLTVTVIPSRDRSQQTWTPQPNEPTQSEDESADQRGQPVRVVSTQVRRTAPWSPSRGDGGRTDSSPLQYNPETAALVGVGPDFRTHARPNTGTSSSSASTVDASSGNATLVVSHQIQPEAVGEQQAQEDLYGAEPGPDQIQPLVHEDRDLEAGNPPLRHRHH